MLDSLRALVKRCTAGDQLAVGEFVNRFQGQVFGLCYRMLNHRQDAEDMTQESMVRAIRNLSRWDGLRPMEPWLFAIAGNRCRSLLAVRKNRLASTDLADQMPDRTPAEHLQRNLAEEVSLAMDGLRAEYRMAFQLFHEQEMSYADIAELLDCPLGTVKTWVHRARQGLVQQLRLRGVVTEAKHALPTI